MTTLAYHNFSDNQYHHRSLMQSGSEGMFHVSPLKRCHSATEYSMPSTSCYNGVAKKPCHSEGDLDAEELITLSYDLINQIQRREQYQSITESSSVTDISREDSNGSTVLSVSADSSSYGYHGYDGRQDVLADIADGNASLSPQSSIDSPVFSEYSPCDSAATKVAKMAISNGKPLYTTELQVLCRICGDRASGYHYGVHSCEGCKGFFRRTLKKELVYKPCRDSAQCRIETGTRNKCQYCRYRKCINAGMSQNAVRFGRMPKVEREKLIADKEELSNTCTSRIMELRALSDRIKGAFQECFEHCKFITNYLQNNAKETSHIKVEPDLCFTTDSMTAQIFAQQNIFQCFQEAILPIIEGTVKFTKKIPNLSDLPMIDRIALLKQNCFCVPVILTYLMFQNSTLFLEGKTSSISVTHLPTTQYSCWEVQCLFDGLFRVAQRMAAVQLRGVEVALFCAIVLLTESPGFSDFTQVEGLQTDLVDSLRLELKHNHPKDKLLFPRLLVLIPQLVQITEEFRSNLKGQLFDSTSNFSQTHELVCELFDLL